MAKKRNKRPGNIGMQFNGEVKIGKQIYNQTEIINDYDAGKDEPFTTVVPVKFSAQQKEALKRMAQEKGMDMSELIRKATDFYLSTIANL